MKVEMEVDKALAHLLHSPRVANRAVRQTFFLLMEDMQRSTIKEIKTGNKTGKVYKNIKIQRAKGKIVTRKRHQSSAPGESHADLSGNLRRSLSWKVYGATGSDFGYGVSVTAANAAPPYSEAIEYGYEPRNLKPRPTLRNELKHLNSKAQVYFNQSLKDQGFEG